MTDAAFQEVFDWLAAREGVEVYIEAGAQDPQVEERADVVFLGLRATLGAVRMVGDSSHGRRALRVVIAGHPPERYGITIDAARLQRAAIHHAGVLRVWQLGVYVGIVDDRVRSPTGDIGA
jgi:hypothetical protein